MEDLAFVNDSDENLSETVEDNLSDLLDENDDNDNDNENNYDNNEDNIQNENNENDTDMVQSEGNILKAEDIFKLSVDNTELSNLPSNQIDSSSLSFDLGHLCAYDATPLDNDKLNDNKISNQYLKTLTRSNTQALINQLFKLPNKIDHKNSGIIARLPPARTKLPREKHIPDNTKKPLTKWSKFALRKGIRKNNKKDESLVWDKEEGKWKRRYGYKRANDPYDKPIIEHKESSNPQNVIGNDPWKQLIADKKKRIEQNKISHKNNLKLLNPKDGVKTIDLQSAINYNKKSIGQRNFKNQIKQGKFNHLNAALEIAQHSTGSMGKFDKKLKYEPKPKLKKNMKNSNDYKLNNYNEEKTKQNEIMFQIFGQENKEKNTLNMDKGIKTEMISMERNRNKNKSIKNKSKSKSKSRSKTKK